LLLRKARSKKSGNKQPLSPDDAWEHGRRGRQHDAADAGGNDMTALQSFVLVASCVFLFSFFV